jgi:Na+-transporting NADH:ubiquinone oxidoreductase subunit NqrF
MNIDIPKHAANRVKLALDDAHQIAADSGEMLRISLLGAGVCIGQACGILHGIMTREGCNVTERQAKERILDILRTMTLDGAEATLRKLRGET